MALNIVADFFGLLNPELFDIATILFVVSFVIWEAPRSLRMIENELTTGIYPESGRVSDIALFVIGLIAVVFIYTSVNVEKVATTLKTPGLTSLFLILLVVLVLLAVISFLVRLFARIDNQNSILVFLMHSFLDLAHTVFFISLIILTVPVIGFLIFGAK